MSDASARILQILLACGMIAREEQEIVRGLLRGQAGPRSSAGGRGRAPAAR